MTAPATPDVPTTPSTPSTPSTPPAPPPLGVVAHRGGAGYAPENTLPAFQNAARLGADSLEMDVVVAADGQPVVIHDDTVARTTDCTLTVSSSASTAITECDAAWWWWPGVAYTQVNATITPLRGRGIRVPLLREVLAWNASRAGGPVAMSIEIKVPGRRTDAQARAATDAVLAEIQSAGLRDRTVIQSFRTAVVDHVKSIDPTVRTAVIVGSTGYATCLAGVQAALARGHDYVYVNYATADLDAACVAYARQTGRKLTVWPVDRPAEIVRARDLGVDEILTSFPACAFDVLGRTYPRPIYTPLLQQTTGLITCAVGS